MTRRLGLVLAVFLAPVLTGCGAKLVPVKGRLVIDGKPAPHAFVRFTPEDPDGKEASATTDADGAFELRTDRLGPGALPALYKVTVAWSDTPPIEDKGMSPSAIQAALAAAPPPSRVLPPTYTQLDQTILKHRVPDDGDVKLNLRSESP